MDSEKQKRVTIPLITFFLICLSVVLASSFYRYYVTKNYQYIVEAPCDTAMEKCFVRDCEADPESCPPNELSIYKKYHVKAADFKSCTDNSCLEQCSTHAIRCQRVICTEGAGDSCSTFDYEQ